MLQLAESRKRRWKREKIISNDTGLGIILCECYLTIETSRGMVRLGHHVINQHAKLARRSSLAFAKLTSREVLFYQLPPGLLQSFIHPPDVRSIVVVTFGNVRKVNLENSNDSSSILSVLFRPAHLLAQTPASNIKQTSLCLRHAST